MSGDELYKRYRPRKLSELFGQDEVVRTLEGFFGAGKVPQAILLAGPSGCGKTTIARILKRRLKCGDPDYVEINAAQTKGIDVIREVQSRMSMSPIKGKVRIYYFDEAHQLTGPAQDAWLKMLEDTPSHVHFLLATTDPQKLSKTTHTRCTVLQVKSLSLTTLRKLVAYVVQAEGVDISEDVSDAICEASEGSARKCLVLLNSIINIKGEDEQLECIKNSDTQKVALDLYKALIRPKPSWSDVAKILKGLENDPEGIRWYIMACAKNLMLGGGKMAPKGYVIINAMRDNFYDSKMAGLAAACWEVVHN